MEYTCFLEGYSGHNNYVLPQSPRFGFYGAGSELALTNFLPMWAENLSWGGTQIFGVLDASGDTLTSKKIFSNP